MLEFKVNKFITLKHENNKTNIYVNGKSFIQCKFLLLEIPIKGDESLDEIKSIDEAAESLDKRMERSGEEEIIIPPEVEFWLFSSEKIRCQSL